MKRRILRFALAGCIGAVLALRFAPGLLESTDALRIDRVALAENAARTPPPTDSRAWRDARLPGDWRPRGSGVPVWCRGEFSLAAAPSVPLQLLVASAGFGAEVFLNGHSISSQGRPPDAVFGRRELLWVSLPLSTLVAGRNVIMLRIQVRPDFAGYLTPIRVGTPQAIQRLRTAWGALQVLPDFLALFSIAVCVMQWLTYRSERRSEWLWAACAFLVLGLGGLRWRGIDFWLWPLAVATASACVICGIHRAGGIRRRPLEIAAFGALASLAIPLALGPVGWRYPLGGAAGVLCFVFAFYVLYLYREGRATSWIARPGVLSAALLATMLLSSNDLPAYYWNRAPLLGVPLFPVGHAFLLFASAFQIVLFMGDRLAQVRGLHRALEESHGRVVHLEREQAARDERLRLQRELHDGLGAQLVSALAVAERAPQDGESLRGALRGALGELRLAVDSLDDAECEVVEALGRLRARLEPLAQGAGIAFSWRVGDVASARRIPPEHAIHLLRILQEAITNAVKHAAARQIEVRSGDASQQGSRVPFVEVRDDGRGFANPGSGRGLANMRARAEQIGGRIEIASNASGTCVTLWLAPIQSLSRPS